MTSKEIQARMEQLTAERDKFIDKANITIAEYNGRLAELRQLAQTKKRRWLWQKRGSE